MCKYTQSLQISQPGIPGQVLSTVQQCLWMTQLLLLLLTLLPQSVLRCPLMPQRAACCAALTSPTAQAHTRCQLWPTGGQLGSKYLAARLS